MLKLCSRSWSTESHRSCPPLCAINPSCWSRNRPGPPLPPRIYNSMRKKTDLKFHGKYNNQLFLEHSRIKVHFVATFLNNFMIILVLYKMLTTFDLIIILKIWSMVSKFKLTPYLDILQNFIQNIRKPKWPSILS